MRNRYRVVQEGGLDELAVASRSYATAEAKLAREMLFAHEAGSSLRAIAEVVGMSPETVRTSIARSRIEREHDLAVMERLAGAGSSVSAQIAAERQCAALAKKWRL